MNHTELITAAEDFAKEQLGQDTTGHDWFHTNRVRNTAALIARMEGASVVICTIAALLHDVADEKLNLQGGGAAQSTNLAHRTSAG